MTSTPPGQPAPPEPATPPPKATTLGRLRDWLRSDMLVLRWVFLGLYLAIVGCLWFSGADQLFLLILGGIILGCQAMFLFGGGTIHLCRPIRKRRLWAPALVAAFMFGGMAGGLFLALSELFYLDSKLDDWAFGLLFWGALIGSWIFWFLVFFLATQRWSRMRTLGQITGALVAGSLAELLVAVPSHMIVIRRPGCLVGLSTMMGITAGLFVMFFAFGPAVFLLFLRPRYRRERIEGPPKNELRWNQFSLRKLFLAMLIVSIVFSGIGGKMQQARKNRRIADEIRETQDEIKREIGEVSIRYEEHADSLDDLFGNPGVFYIDAVESWGGLGGGDLELLQRAPKLRRLDLAGHQPLNVAIESLKELSSLEHLYLSCTGITAEELLGLEHLDHLQELTLFGARYTDADLESLKSLTNLRQLNLTGTRATGEGVQRLQEALPNCEIVFAN